NSLIMDALNHSIEGCIETIVCDAYSLKEKDVNAITHEVGIPIGWHPLIAGYDTPPYLPDTLNLPQLPQDLFDYLAKHKRISPGEKELIRLKAKLQTFYESGLGAKNIHDYDETDDN